MRGISGPSYQCDLTVKLVMECIAVFHFFNIIVLMFGILFILVIMRKGVAFNDSIVQGHASGEKRYIP